MNSQIEIQRPPVLRFGAWAKDAGHRSVLVVADASNAGRVDVPALPGGLTLASAP